MSPTEQGAEGKDPQEQAEGVPAAQAPLRDPPGCWGGLIFACLSFTPSLLPRGGLIQGIVCGITAAIGYGLGTLAAWIWRAFADREPRRPRSRSWSTLGYQGRNFTGKGPTVSDIEKFTHHPAMEPIRTYAGLASAPDAEARAELAVRDLQRAGGFQRKNLLVVTTTGSGWVDPALVDAFEYLSGGDCATVAIQYSYLPSWLSYLVDQSKASEAGRALFDVVYGAWSKLPPGQRPRLFVGGESLGSFGAEAAFSGEYDLANRTAGALFAGPPNFNPLFSQFLDHRDTGSPEVQPVFQDGRTVRFTNDPTTAIPPAGQPWNGTRVLYMMHPSDPIVWWSPHLIFSPPDWISEAPGTDVLSAMIWMPFVTFWQVTADLPFSTGVPGGHGHTYTAEYVDGWDAVMQPTGITAQDLVTLREIIAGDG